MNKNGKIKMMEKVIDLMCYQHIEQQQRMHIAFGESFEE
jgi:hypothetical protein